MERVQPQSLAWRAFAVVVVLFGVSQGGRLLPGAGFDFATVRLVYWSLALAGLVGYAFGFRWLPQSFWRAYALLFAVEITIRLAPFARAPVAGLFDVPEANRHATPIILLALALTAAVCVALLRYGGWLRTPAGGATASEQKAKAAFAALFKRKPANRRRRASKYPMPLCVFASLAGAAALMVVMQAWLGQWSYGFALVGFPFALLAFAVGGRSLAEKLASAGKDTLVRGTVIGASIGVLVSGLAAAAFSAVIFSDAPLGFSDGLKAALFAALIAAPIGAVYGAGTGAALILLGRRRAREANGRAIA